jgi:hypothetical protein
MMRRAFILAIISTIPVCAAAQRMVAPPHVSGRPAAFFAHTQHSRNSLAAYYPLGFWDPLYSDYLSSAGYPAASQPPVIVVQAPATTATQEVPAAPVQPLLIELQGDRYVQVSTDTDKDSRTMMTDEVSGSAMLQRSSPVPSQTSRPRENVNALLIFRDGHREEASSYTIAGGLLYASADYYTAGSWNRKIEVSSLNLPETVSANQSRGIRFSVPSAPNEVIVGP